MHDCGLSAVRDFCIDPNSIICDFFETESWIIVQNVIYWESLTASRVKYKQIKQQTLTKEAHDEKESFVPEVFYC